MIEPIPPTAGELLVAAVGQAAGFFDQSVILLLDSDAGGTLGVVLNRVASRSLDDVLPDWVQLVTPPAILFAGGPLSPDGAICVARIANRAEDPPGWKQVCDDIGLLHLDTPTELAKGCYTDLRIFAGYAGWEPDQLEDELMRGLWYRTPARQDDVFGVNPDDLWRRVLRRQGGHLGLLSTWSDDPELN